VVPGKVVGVQIFVQLTTPSSETPSYLVWFLRTGKKKKEKVLETWNRIHLA
jgi:hypothetical protein